MQRKLKVSEAIAEYANFQASQGRSAHTIENSRLALGRFHRTTGDLNLSSVGDEHVTRYMSRRAGAVQASSLGLEHSVLAAFFKWAVRAGYYPRFSNPMEGRKAPKAMPRDRQRIPVTKFTALLNSTQVPSHRMVLALGLYLFLRASEITDLRIRDVDLDSGEIKVRVWKTKQIDSMPICSELDGELRRWLTTYTQRCGPLDPAWRLTPALRAIPPRQPAPGEPVVPLPIEQLPPNPTAPISYVQGIVHKGLQSLGMATHDEQGKSLMEGIHTLRRSGARARYDVLVDLGYDGAIRMVQVMLHHSSIAMTERYIGLDLDRHKRNQITKGVEMFPLGGDNLVKLRDHG